MRTTDRGEEKKLLENIKKHAHKQKCTIYFSTHIDHIDRNSNRNKKAMRHNNKKSIIKNPIFIYKQKHIIISTYIYFLLLLICYYYY